MASQESFCLGDSKQNLVDCELLRPLSVKLSVKMIPPIHSRRQPDSRFCQQIDLRLSLS